MTEVDYSLVTPCCIYAVDVSCSRRLDAATHHNTTFSSPSVETPAAPVAAVADYLVTLQLQDSVSVRPDLHCCSEIELACSQVVSQRPAARPIHYCALVDCLRRLFDWDSSQAPRLRALLANLESGAVPRLNGRQKLLLGLAKVVHLLLVHPVHREELLQTHQLVG